MGIGPCCLRMSARALNKESTQWASLIRCTQPQRGQLPATGTLLWKPVEGARDVTMSTLKTVSSGAGLQGNRKEVGMTLKGCEHSTFFSAIYSTSVNNKPFQNTSFPETYIHPYIYTYTYMPQQHPQCLKMTLATGPPDGNRGCHLSGGPSSGSQNTCNVARIRNRSAACSTCC